MDFPQSFPLSSPITKIKTIVYTQFEMRIHHFTLGQNSIEIEIRVYDETKENEKIFCYLLQGEEYGHWTTDEYIINWVKDKLKNEVF